jgi:hypothetical protein
MQALSLEVERHAEVGLVGAELGGDLGDEKLSEWLADHPVSFCGDMGHGDLPPGPSWGRLPEHPRARL